MVGFGFLAALMAITAIGPMSLTIFIPALPAVQAEFASDVQYVQMTLSLPLLAVIVAPPIAGGVCDRVGRRPVVLASLLILVISCGVCIAAPNLMTLVIGRIVVGVSGTCALIVARAIVRDVYDAENLSKAMAKFSIAPVVTILLAPSIGGLITDTLGWRGVFWFLSAASMLTLAMAFFLLRETLTVSDTEVTKSETKAAWRKLTRSVVFWGYTWQSVFHFAAAVGFVAAAPYLMVNVLGHGALDYGIGLVVVVLGMLAGVLMAGRLTQTLSIPMLVMIGCVLCVIANLVLPGLLVSKVAGLSAVLLFGSTALVAVGIGFAMPASQAGIVGTVPELSGTASGISSCLQMIMAAVFSHLVALPWDRPALALGLISLAAMTLALAFSAVSLSASRAR